MVVINPANHGVAKQIRGKIGASSAYGTAGYGLFEYGAGADVFGIYQVRSRFGKQVVVKEKYYNPTNPQSIAQQTNRQKYADSIVAWQGLTSNQKEIYNERARYNPYSGYNLFQREYLLSH